VKIVGIEKLSFVDYPGMLAAVFFTPGCNYDCYYCHNRALIHADADPIWLSMEVALAWLDDRRGFLDAVVISGGEPTRQPGLADFIRSVRAKGYLVKLDTNGSNPAVLGDLIAEGLLDFVAMDVKAPPARYDELCGVPVNLGAIEDSIQILLGDAVPYEFRTTVAPQLSEADVVAIAHWVRGARRYVLQQFRRPQEPDEFADLRNAVAPHPSAWPERVLPQLRHLVAACETRGFDAAASKANALEPIVAVLKCHHIVQ